MTIRSTLGQLHEHILSAAHTRPLGLGGQEPFVSFCFDDFPQSAYTAGGAILKSFGVRGTYYAALGLLNTSNVLGDQLRQADIESLLRDGHELGSHTFSHSSCRTTSFADFKHDVLKGCQVIREMIGYDADSFAYPFGHASLRCKREISHLMSSARGICGGINGPSADLNLLRANSLYGDLDRLPRVAAIIAENVRRKGWLIFYTHDVRQNNSPFGCTPALLDRAVALARESGCRIVTVGAAISEMRRAGARRLSESAGETPSSLKKSGRYAEADSSIDPPAFAPSEEVRL